MMKEIYLLNITLVVCSFIQTTYMCVAFNRETLYHTDSNSVLCVHSFSRTIGSVALLRKEVEELRTELAKCTSPIVLCHNDLVFGNLIYDDESGEQLGALSYLVQWNL